MKEKRIIQIIQSVIPVTSYQRPSPPLGRSPPHPQNSLLRPPPNTDPPTQWEGPTLTLKLSPSTTSYHRSPSTQWEGSPSPQSSLLRPPTTQCEVPHSPQNSLLLPPQPSGMVQPPMAPIPSVQGSIYYHLQISHHPKQPTTTTYNCPG